jgi:hypothetical protein
MLGTGVLAVRWLFADVDAVRRGTLAWYVALPGYLTALPTPEACDAPLYSFHRAGGARPQVAAVRFTTLLSPEDSRDAYAALLAGCRPGAASASSWRWRCEGREYDEIDIEFGAAASGACRRIDVRFTTARAP